MCLGEKEAWGGDWVGVDGATGERRTSEEAVVMAYMGGEPPLLGYLGVAVP